MPSSVKNATKPGNILLGDHGKGTVTGGTKISGQAFFQVKFEKSDYLISA